MRSATGKAASFARVIPVMYVCVYASDHDRVYLDSNLNDTHLARVNLTFNRELHIKQFEI